MNEGRQPGLRFAWSPPGSLLASAGAGPLVRVQDRLGQAVGDFSLVDAAPRPGQSAASALVWCAAGDRLAAVGAGSDALHVWRRVGRGGGPASSSATTPAARLPSHDVSCAAWDGRDAAPGTSLVDGGRWLFMGTRKGVGLLYDDEVGSVEAVAGPLHSKAVTSALGLGNGRFATASEDRTVHLTSVTGGRGAPLGSLRLSGVPAADSLRWRPQPGGAGGRLSCVVDQRRVWIGAVGHAGAPDATVPPVELSFDPALGDIVGHWWLGLTHVVVVFRTGCVAVRPAEGDQDRSPAPPPVRVGNGATDATWCEDLGHLSFLEGSVIQVCSVRLDPSRVDTGGVVVEDLRDDRIALPPPQLGASLAWTGDGQVLAAATQQGLLVAYVAALPLVSATCGSTLAWLSSLAEVTVLNASEAANADAEVRVLRLPASPTMIAVGPGHVASCLNHQVWYQPLSDSAAEGTQGDGSGDPTFLSRHVMRDLVGTIDALAITATHGVALSEGRLHIHPLPATGGRDTNAPRHHTADSVDDADDEDDVMLPGRGRKPNVSCVGCSDDLIFYGTDDAEGAAPGATVALGRLVTYSPAAHAVLSETRHPRPIRRVWPSPSGTRVVFSDHRGDVILLSPASGAVIYLVRGGVVVGEPAGALPVATVTLPPPSSPGEVTGVVWDSQDPALLVLCGTKETHALLHLSESCHGPHCRRLMVRPSGSAPPVCLSDGRLLCSGGGGALTAVVLDTHLPFRPDVDSTTKQRFDALIDLARLDAAWPLAAELDTPAAWTAFAFAALDLLEFGPAVGALRSMGDAGLVLAFSSLLDVEDRDLRAGHVLALVHKDYDAAQALFLRSSRPLAALELRRDLRHWDRALELAAALDPAQTPAVEAEVAASLETRGDHERALGHWEAASRGEEAKPAPLRDGHLLAACRAGRAKALVHVGRVEEGARLCSKADDPELSRACAGILEASGRPNDAAALWAAAGQVDRAAAIHVRARQWGALRPLLPQVADPAVHSAYASAQEAEGRLADALASYEAAGDVVNAVRLLLDRLHDPARAHSLARSSKHPEAALAVARSCLAAGQPRPAVEYLVLAKRAREAFDVAARQDAPTVDWLVRCLGDGGADDDDTDVFELLAGWYVARDRLREAARCLFRCREWSRGVDLLLKVGSDEAIEEAIGAVSSHAPAAEQIMDHLERVAHGVGVAGPAGVGADGAGAVGGADGAAATGSSGVGAPADLRRTLDKYLFRLQLAAGRPEEAATHAVRHARREREESGDYRAAHRTLADAWRELRRADLRVPPGLFNSLALLHGYLLVRPLSLSGDHVGAARLLARTSDHLGRFPLHEVPILTSTVLACQRAGLGATAFRHASALLRPEFRSRVDPKHRRKIEAVVRGRGRAVAADAASAAAGQAAAPASTDGTGAAEDPPEPTSACPKCDAPGPEFELECGQCRSFVPFCAATGRRCVLSDLCSTPCCGFPARASALAALAASSGDCPMCGEKGLKIETCRALGKAEAKVHADATMAALNG